MKKIISLAFVMLIINLLAPSNLLADNCLYQCADGAWVQGGNTDMENCNQISNCNRSCRSNGHGTCLWDIANKSLPRPTSTASKSGFVKSGLVKA